MICDRAFILLVLFSEHERMNAGRLIAYNIHDMIRKNNALGHSCLINLLCHAAGVLPELADVYLKSQTPVVWGVNLHLPSLTMMTRISMGSESAPAISVVVYFYFCLFFEV